MGMADILPAQETARPPKPPLRPVLGLAGKLLALTVLFVMVAEILIFVRSISNFRLRWLNDHLAAARTAVLVLDATPGGLVPEELTRKILGSIGAKAVAMKMGDQRRLLAVANTLPPIDQEFDLRTLTTWGAIYDAFQTMSESTSDIIRVVGDA